MFHAKMKMRPVLIEIHRVIDAQTVEAIDLLEADSKPFQLVDRSMAARAIRFGTFVESSRQPHLAAVLVFRLMDLVMTPKKNGHPEPQSKLELIIALKGAIECLDRAIRG